MTVSEEQLRVGTERREAGRARLRKYVVTENVTQTVPVQREEVRVEREPITDANAATRPPVRPSRRRSTRSSCTRSGRWSRRRPFRWSASGSDTETVTEQETVSGEVRKERVEVDDDRDVRR